MKSCAKSPKISNSLLYLAYHSLSVLSFICSPNFAQIYSCNHFLSVQNFEYGNIFVEKIHIIYSATFCENSVMKSAQKIAKNLKYLNPLSSFIQLSLQTR